MSCSGRAAQLIPRKGAEGGGIDRVHQPMDVTGEDLLPRAALARDEDHRDAGGGELPALLLQLVDLVRFPDDLLVGEVGTDLPKVFDLVLQVHPLGDPPDDDLHLVQVERLRQVVRGADLHRLDGGLRRVVRGQHDHLGANPLPDDLPEDVDAVPPRELDVQQHDVGGECPDPVQDAFGIALRADVVPVPAQRPLQHGDDQFVVVQQEDLSLGLHAAAPSALTGSRMVNSTPPPGRFATAIVPSCCSIICREIARPSPVPFGFVVKNG